MPSSLSTSRKVEKEKMLELTVIRQFERTGSGVPTRWEWADFNRAAEAYSEKS